MSSNNSQKNQEVIAHHLGTESASQNTKAEILNAYLRIAVREGSTGLTVSGIADEAGISKQLVKYHTPDLDETALELFKIMGQIGSQFTEMKMRAVKNSGEKLEAWVNANFDWLLEYPDFAQFVLFMYYRASVDKRVRELHRKHLQAAKDRLFDLLGTQGEKLSNKERTYLAQILQQQMVATLIEMLSLRDSKNELRYRNDYLSFMKAWINR